MCSIYVCLCVTECICLRVRTCVMSPQPPPPRCRHHEHSPQEGHMDTRPPRVQRSYRLMGSLALPRRFHIRYWVLSVKRPLRYCLLRIAKGVETPSSPVTRRQLCTHIISYAFYDFTVHILCHLLYTTQNALKKAFRA